MGNALRAATEDENIAFQSEDATHIVDSRFYLIHQTTGRSLFLQDGFVLGRAMPCFEKDTLLSRQHCRFHVRDGQVDVVDLHSSNKTWLNGKPITPGRRHRLRSGDVLGIGCHRFEFMDRKIDPAQRAWDPRFRDGAEAPSLWDTLRELLNPRSWGLASLLSCGFVAFVALDGMNRYFEMLWRTAEPLASRPVLGAELILTFTIPLLFCILFLHRTLNYDCKRLPSQAFALFCALIIYLLCGSVLEGKFNAIDTIVAGDLRQECLVDHDANACLALAQKAGKHTQELLSRLPEEDSARIQRWLANQPASLSL